MKSFIFKEDEEDDIDYACDIIQTDLIENDIIEENAIPITGTSEAEAQLEIAESPSLIDPNSAIPAPPTVPCPPPPTRRNAGTQTDPMENSHPKLKKAAIMAGVAIGTGAACVALAPIALAGAGFTAAGVAAGSVAAAAQSVIGNVAVGSIFAGLQSAGVLGFGAATTAGIGAGGAAVGSGAAYWGTKFVDRFCRKQAPKPDPNDASTSGISDDDGNNKGSQTEDQTDEEKMTLKRQIS